MQPALRPLYTVPIGDHCALVLRLPGGGVLDLVLYDGGGCCRSVAIWRFAKRTLGAVVAAEA